MNSFGLLVLFVAAASALPHLALQDPQWVEFKKTHNKHYSSVEDELIHLEVFQAKLVEIAEHNQRYEQGLVTWRKGINQFSDWTEAERRSRSEQSRRRKISLNSQTTQIYEVPEFEHIPDQLDWRESNLVTRVWSHRECYASYAFAAVGSIEGQYAKVNNVSAIGFSVQNIVDCSKDGTYQPTYAHHNWGCEDGFVDVSLEYILEFGINTEADYPFIYQEGTCAYNPYNEIVVHISYYSLVTSTDEKALKSAVANVGPIAVSLNSYFIYDYDEGIAQYDECDHFYLQTSMLVVGYGTENGTDYWLLKSDWGINYGEDGYLRLARNVGNMCGVADEAYFPTII